MGGEEKVRIAEEEEEGKGGGNEVGSNKGETVIP